jgi:hypothetical protein
MALQIFHGCAGYVDRARGWMLVLCVSTYPDF